MIPLGTPAFSALFEQNILASTKKWMNHNGKVKFRNDALSKVRGQKTFGNIRSKDMPNWPDKQGHP